MRCLAGRRRVAEIAGCGAPAASPPNSVIFFCWSAKARDDCRIRIDDATEVGHQAITHAGPFRPLAKVVGLERIGDEIEDLRRQADIVNKFPAAAPHHKAAAERATAWYSLKPMRVSSVA